MRKSIVVLVAVLALAQSAAARKQPVPKLTPGGSAIGIEVHLRVSIGLTTGSPDTVFFVRTDAEHGLVQDKFLPADYVSGNRAYLLNVVPGEYAAVACTNRDPGAKVPFLGALQDVTKRASGENPNFMTYFSSEVAESTRVAVGAGEFAFAGNFHVRQGSMKSADPVQKHYAELIRGPNGHAGRAEETKRDDVARRTFLAAAKEDLAEGGWSELILAAANPAEKHAPVSQSPVALARALVDRAEAGQVSEAEFTLKSKAVEEWLVAHPDDVDALIVAARLHWLERTASPVAVTAGEKPPDPALAYLPAHKLLDRALALQPGNAEAHYWKARLYGVIAPYFGEDVFGYRPLDQAQSITFARKAVELAPAEPRYSVVLAQYLNGHQEPKEAIKVLAALPDGQRHPLYALLSDFEAFPLPEKAVFDPVVTQSVTQVQTERGELPNYRHERIRVYIMPGTVKDFEPFFTQHWPGFKLDQPMEEDRELGMALYALAYRWVGGKWEAQSRLPKTQQGLMVAMVTEMRKPDPQTLKRLPIPVVGSYCIVALADYRP